MKICFAMCGPELILISKFIIVNPEYAAVVVPY